LPEQAIKIRLGVAKGTLASERESSCGICKEPNEKAETESGGTEGRRADGKEIGTRRTREGKRGKLERAREREQRGRSMEMSTVEIEKC